MNSHKNILKIKYSSIKIDFFGGFSVIARNVSIAPTAIVDETVSIGENTIIQHGAIIEKQCNIGSNCRIGSYAVLRPGTIIGDHSIFGNLSVSEGHNQIGHQVTIFSQCHITEAMIIEDNVFIGPSLCSTNTKNISHGRENISLTKQGPYIKFGARIGGGVTLLPAVVIGREALIGAGAVVTKDIPDYAIAVGVPAKVVGQIPEEEKYPMEVYLDFLRRHPQE